MFGRPTKWKFLLKAFPLWQPLTDFWRKTTNWPVVGKLVSKMHDENHYDVTFIPINKNLQPDESMVLPKQVVEDIIRQSCHRVIMKVCLCRVSCGCEDYPMEYGCIFLGESTRNIDPSMGKAVSAEEALEYMNKCIDTGLIPQIGRVDADPFMLGMKDWDKFLTLCFCCSCCCVAMRRWRQWSPDIRARMHKLDGIRLEVTDKCTGCGACVPVCFTSSISLAGDRINISNDCLGCGQCVDACPNDAIELIVEDGNKMLANAINRIKSYADIS